MKWRLFDGCRTAALLAGLALVAAPGVAAAQMETREGITLQNQILELRNQLEMLRAQIPAGGGSVMVSPYPAERVAPPGDLSTQLLTRLATLEEQVRGLTGRLDELANQVRRQGDELTKQVGDLSFRLQTLEGGGRSGRAMTPRAEGPAAARTAEPPAMSPPPSTLGSLPPLPPPTPYESPPATPPYYAPYATDTGGRPLLPPEPRSDYAPASPYATSGPLPLLPPPEPQGATPRRGASAQAMAGALPLLPGSQTEAAARPAGPRTVEVVLREGESALARRDYVAAEAAAREVLGSGSASRAADGQFLLAQSLAGARNYPQAAVAFDDAYNRAPTGPHAQEALLGMASALASVGAKPAACAALDKLRTEFLTQRAGVRETAASLRQREACRP